MAKSPQRRSVLRVLRDPNCLRGSSSCTRGTKELNRIMDDMRKRAQREMHDIYK
jgi:hypothetical protein